MKNPKIQRIPGFPSKVRSLEKNAFPGVFQALGIKLRNSSRFPGEVRIMIRVRNSHMYTCTIHVDALLCMIFFTVGARLWM